MYHVVINHIGKNNLQLDLSTSSFPEKNFNNDIQSHLIHFPRLLEQCKGKTGSKYAHFIEKLVDNALMTLLSVDSCYCSFRTLF